MHRKPKDWPLIITIIAVILTTIAVLAITA